MADNNSNGGGRWQTITAVGSVAAVIVLIIGVIYQAASLSYNTTANTITIDRQSAEIARLEGRLNDAANKLTVLDTQQAEIETQFCSQSTVVNLMHGKDLGLISELWSRAFGHPYPLDNTYYPIIGRCR
jgi:hypothetical protein